MTQNQAAAERGRGRRAVWLAGVLGLAAACGGGGGGGGPVGPDVTPPGVPVAAKIAVEPPLPATLVRLTGSAGSVENSATVRLSNSTAAQRTGQPVTATEAAGPDGAFSMSLQAQLGDQLQVTAADAAGNVSGALSLTAGPVPTSLSVVDPGDEQLLTLSSGEGAFQLPFPTGSERYTLVVQSLNPGIGTFPITVSGSQAAGVRSLQASALPEGGSAALEAEFRTGERQAIRSIAGQITGPSRSRGLAPSDDPLLGSVRTFNVVNRLSGFSLTTRGHFDIVFARLLYKGDHTLIYVDERVPSEDVPDALIETVGDRFDQQTYQVDRGAFGNESDIDANGRVIILLTATVNGFSTEQNIDDGITTGFFFAIDLIDVPIGNPFGNDAEIFYTLAPDPDREFGASVVTVAGLTQSLHAILAHEFEHMINAAARVDRGALEDVWLDEGLAHYAETLNAEEGGDVDNVLRAGLYLEKPSTTSVVDPGASLTQRGAAWLLLSYLADHKGPTVIRQLVQSGLVGTHNIEVSANTSFPFLFHLFTSALFLDGQELTSDPALEFSGLDVREIYERARSIFTTFSRPRFLGPFLAPQSAALPGSSASSANVRGSSAVYFDVGSGQIGTLPVLLRASRESNLQVTIIRTR